MNLAELLDHSALILTQAGVDNARHDAHKLVEHALDITPLIRLTQPEKPLDKATYARVLTSVARRAAREPLQHILGSVEFYGLEFLCDSRALIPRNDSETLVDAVLANTCEGFTGTITDFGTGSGCLLASILVNRPLAKGIAIENDPCAFTLAKENFTRHALHDRVTLFNKSWHAFDAYDDTDIIISNPPYIALEAAKDLAPEVAKFDPKSALFGGQDGLDAYRELLALWKSLSPRTTIYLEIGAEQTQKLKDLCEIFGFQTPKIKQDLEDRDRVLITHKTSSDWDIKTA